MRVLFAMFVVGVVGMIAGQLPAQSKPPAQLAPPERISWESTLTDRIPLLGHRNWIAIVDSAYPAQTSPGIETVVTGAEQLAVVQNVLSTLHNVRHVRPVIYLDAELAHVPAADASGIDEYRTALAKLLGDRPVQRLPHGDIINRLDAAGAKFHVLVLKTNLAMPYTSVFLELDCAYWSTEAEQRLRDAMAAETK